MDRNNELNYRAQYYIYTFLNSRVAITTQQRNMESRETAEQKGRKSNKNV